MMSNKPTNVLAAFAMLVEEIETEIDSLGRQAAHASENRDFEQARAVIAHAEVLTAFRNKVIDLQKEWEQLVAEEKGIERKNSSHTEKPARLRPGLRTREEAYYEPILKALVALGGSARMQDVLSQVEQMMEGVLEVDYAPLPSDPNVPRWRNAAQWARYTMVKAGWLKEDSPRGTWEITDQGRQRLLEGFSSPQGSSV